MSAGLIAQRNDRLRAMANADDSTFDNLWFPQPDDLSPEGFELFVASAFGEVGHRVSGLQVEHQRVEHGSDGDYSIDASVRFQLWGVNYVNLVEAKCHKDPIKREVVQVLDSKVRSVGAHKGIIFSTSRFQSGAVDFAGSHGIALVVVTEGRFTFSTRSAERSAGLTVERARELGLPDLVAYSYEPTDDGAIRRRMLTGNNILATEQLLGIPPES